MIEMLLSVDRRQTAHLIFTKGCYPKLQLCVWDLSILLVGMQVISIRFRDLLIDIPVSR